jgi:hypothetical protein
MLIKDYKRSIPYLIKAKVVPLVWGAHGIGKSAVVRQICDENDWKFTDLRIGSMSDAGDLIGLPDFVTDEKGNKVATSFFVPDWLKENVDFCKQNPDKYAVLFLDEINRARKDLQTPLFQMILDHRLHTHVFPDNLFIVAAANYNTEDYNVGDFSDKALSSRFAHAKLSPSVNEWIDHGQSQKIDDGILSFIREQEGMLEKKGEPFSLDFVEPCRRSWIMVNNLKKSGMPAELLQEWMYGIIGVPATAAYLDHQQNAEKPLTGEEIVKHYKKHQDRIRKIVETPGFRTDLLNHSANALIETIKKLQTEGTALKKAEGSNLVSFLDDVPTELGFKTLQEIYLQDIVRPFFNEDTDLVKKFEKAKGQANG